MNQPQNKLRIILCLVFLSSISFSSARNKFVDKDLTITYTDKLNLDELLKRLEPSITQDYMKKEIYLIRWLRAANSDLNEATRLMQEHLNWRKVNNIDSILNEDFEAVNEDYPIHVDSVDYDGAPVATINVKEWDTRRAVLTGQADKLYRFLFYRIEEGLEKLREGQANGLNITRLLFIEDLKGFSSAQHACIPCLTLQIRWTVDLQANYPEAIGHIIYINAPRIFEAAFQVVRPILNSESRDLIKIFGTNREQWEKFILDLVPPDQLHPNFGGTKPYAI